VKPCKSKKGVATCAAQADNLERLMGFEGAGAAQYYSAFGECLRHREFVFAGRSRRPPGNPVNAMLSFGYQILWNHLLALIELQGLDPYQGSLHQGSERHAALASDLVEQFRAPIVDSLVLWLVNKNVMDVGRDFVYRDGGCYLSKSGRKKFLNSFVLRMEAEIQTDSGEKQPRWDLLNRQVKGYGRFVRNPTEGYHPYRIE
jgi:CRISPR-associated protein Cas1